MSVSFFFFFKNLYKFSLRHSPFFCCCALKKTQQSKTIYLWNISSVLTTPQSLKTSLQIEPQTIFTHPSVFYCAHQQHNEHQPAQRQTSFDCMINELWSSGNHSVVSGKQRPLVGNTNPNILRATHSSHTVQIIIFFLPSSLLFFF